MDGLSFKFIGIMPGDRIEELPNTNVLEMYREAALYCLISNKKITLERKNYGTGLDMSVEISPFKIIETIVPKHSQKAVEFCQSESK